MVLTARDERRGIEAVGALGALGLSNVLFHQLEVSDPLSAARSADFIKEKFGKLDILVSGEFLTLAFHSAVTNGIY